MTPALRGTLLAALLLPGCAHAAPAPARPALIDAPDAASRADLKAALKRLTGRSTVVESDALTRESALILEPVIIRDASGRRLQGRDLGRPVILELKLSGRRCVLVNRATGAGAVLAHTRCHALP